MLTLASLSQCFPPPADRDPSVVSIALPQGARLQETMRIADQTAVLLKAAPEVDKYYEEVGSRGPNFATVTIKLKPPGERKRTSAEFERDMAPRLAAIVGARVSFRDQPAESAH